MKDVALYIECFMKDVASYVECFMIDVASYVECFVIDVALYTETLQLLHNNRVVFITVSKEWHSRNGFI